MGLTYGSVGFAFMTFVTLLSVRKKLPIWRIGRTQSDARPPVAGRAQLSVDRVPRGLRFGHGPTSWLMWLFVFV